MTITVSLLAQPNEIAGTVNVTGLTAFTEYYVNMSLVNDAGEGPYSNETTTMTLQDSEFIYIRTYTHDMISGHHCVEDEVTSSRIHIYGSKLC